MKRSEINRHLSIAEAFFAEMGFRLPPFALWTPEDWRSMGPEADEIRERGLGWDVTDLGKARFDRQGLVLFTLRNGDIRRPGDAKCYAEKVMMVGEGQVTPWHFHWRKAEDIINRGGGELVVELAWATPEEAGLSDDEVTVSCDGVVRRVLARGRVALSPGESITLPPRLYHQFYGRPGGGPVLAGEVSRTNDDHRDNRFLEPLGRFPEIVEDEPPYRLLCHEYPPAGA